MRRAAALVVLMIILALVLLVVRPAPRQPPSSTATLAVSPSPPETVAIRIRAPGRVVPKMVLALGFPISGRLAELRVQVGQQVSAGEELARLGSHGLELAVAQAEASLRVSESRLAQVQALPQPAEVLAAEAALESAQAQYDAAKAEAQLLAGQLAVAELEVKIAETVLREAQAAYDRVAWRPDIGMLPESVALERVTLEYRLALARRDFLLAAANDTSWIHSHEARIAHARAELEKLRQPRSAEQIALAKDEVEAAQIALQQAKLRLADAVLTAPISGTVISIKAQAGEVVVADAPVLLLADLEQYFVIADVTERDVGSVQIGQGATIILDAFAGERLGGRVIAADWLPSSSGGEARYPVTVEILGTKMLLRPGLSATVEFSAAPTALSTVPARATPTADPYERVREHMVNFDIAGRGVSDPAVLQAMRAVPRHEFVLPDYLDQAYADHPLPIGYGQTISQPYIVAAMTELLRLKRGDKVLEIGLGSGYQAAILAELTDQVYSVEIIEPLYKRATETLQRLGYTQVKTKHADGYYGWEEHAPYDAIIVTCAPDHIPQPLINQLKDGGRLVIPVGPPGSFQTLWLVEKQGDKVTSKSIMGVVFVPLTGTHPGR